MRVEGGACNVLKTEVPSKLLKGLAFEMRSIVSSYYLRMHCSLKSCLIILTTVLLLLCPLSIFLTKE